MGNLRNSPRWRLTAITALLLLGLTAVIGIWLVVRNPVFAIIFGLTCAGAAVVVWRWLFGRRSGRTWPYAIAAGLLLAALVCEVLIFLRDQRNVWLMLALLAVCAMALGLGGLLRRRYQQESSVFVVPAGEKPFLIINPKSGSGRAMKANIPELARAEGIQVLMLEPGGSLTGLVRAAVDSGATILGMSGGDGSLGVAAAAAMRHDLPMVALPGGTRCHFARDIGLDPEHMADSLRSFGGREIHIDAAEINGRTFLNNASFGLYADVVGRPGYRERKLGSTLDVLGSEATAGGYPLKFHDGDRRQRKRAVMVLVGVNRYETLNVLELGSRRRLDEGVLQVTAIYRLEQSLMTQLAGAMNLMGSASKHPDDVAQWVAPEFTIAGAAGKLAAGVDGELVEFDSPVHLKLLPRRLRLMVPPEGRQQRRTARTAVERLRDFAVSGKLPHE